MTRRLRRITPSEYFHAYLDGSAAYLRLSGGNIQSLCGEFLLCFMGLRQLESQPTNQGVGSSNLSGRATQATLRGDRGRSTSSITKPRSGGGGKDYGATDEEIMHALAVVYFADRVTRTRPGCTTTKQP